jgi:hypothetical protein
LLIVYSLGIREEEEGSWTCPFHFLCYLIQYENKV